MNGNRYALASAVRTIGAPQSVSGNIDHAKICRIDLCLDIPRKSVEYFVSNIQIPRIQNYKIFRSRGAVSYYLQISSSRTTLIYDKRAEQRANQSPDNKIVYSRDSLTRIEVQLKGAGVPFKRLENIHKYARIDLLENLRWLRLRTKAEPSKAAQYLAQEGLRALIRTNGLQRVSKMFPSAVWAWIREKYFEPMQNSDRPKLNARLRKSVQEWLDRRIRFPRTHNWNVRKRKLSRENSRCLCRQHFVQAMHIFSRTDSLHLQASD